jgi:hypothetical protein
MEFSKNNFSIIVSKKQYESNDEFFERGWFIVSQSPQNKNELKLVILFSNIWINTKKRNCVYNDKIVNKIKKYEQNM